MLYFEKIIDSPALEIPCTLHPVSPMSNICVTTVEYPNQDIDIDTTYQYIS